MSFFNRNTLNVARELLGCMLCRRWRGRIIRGVITETEAYCGPDDLASHARRGITPRTAVMFGPPGHLYVYLIYGMYWCLNIVTERVGYPAAVLIRAAHTIGSPPHRTNGPGKLCRHYHITGALNTQPLGHRTGLWIDAGLHVPPRQVQRAPRIGVDYAGAFRFKPWRFILRSGRIRTDIPTLSPATLVIPRRPVRQQFSVSES